MDALSRRTLILLTAAVVAVGLATNGAAAGAAGGVSRCATSGLVIWLDTNGNGAAGSIYYHLRFTNQSGHTCTLRGYPGVSAVDLAGHQLGSPAARNPLYRSRTITLTNGKTVSAVLRIVDAGVFSPSLCHQRQAAGLRVYPPNRTRAKYVPFPFQACSRRGTTYLDVTAVH